MEDVLLNNIFNRQSEPDQYLSILKELRTGRPRDLREIQKEFGLDGALHYFYQKQISQKSVKNFRKTLDIFKTEYKESHKNYELLIVAPPKGVSRKWSEDQLQNLTQVTLDAGFSRFEIFQESMTSVIEGAMQLRQVIKKMAARKRPVLLLSFSHGSAITRFAIDNLETYQLSNIIGWVNFSGLVFGTPYYSCPKKEPLFNKEAEKLLRSFSYEQRYFLKPVQNKEIPFISFLGCQTSLDMMRAQKRAYKNLKAWGPNDGFIPFRDYERMPGVVVPIWGQGHFFDYSSMRPLLQKTLCYLTSMEVLGSRQHTWGMGGKEFVEPESVYEISL